jgi:hypothetical protein
MKSKEDPPADTTRKKTVFWLFAGIGIFFGWVGNLFRRAPRPVEQTPAARGNADLKPEDALTQIAVAADAPAPTGGSTIASLTESIPLQQIQAALDREPGPQPLSPSALPSSGSSGTETEMNRQRSGEYAVPWAFDGTPKGPHSPSNSTLIDPPNEELSAVQIAGMPIIANTSPPLVFVPAAEDEGASDYASGVQLSSEEVVSIGRPEAECKPEQGPSGTEEALQPLGLSDGIPIIAAATAGAAITVATEKELISRQPATQAVRVSRTLGPMEGGEAAGFTEAESQSLRSSGTASAENTEKRSSSPATYRPRPPEPSEEYASSFAGLPSEYLKWNRWIVEHTIGSTRKNADVYLSITPTILAGIAEATGEISTSPRDVEADFSAAVSDAYASIIVREGRLRILRRFDAQGQPVCVAFLAASVLAAYNMQSDEDAYGGAYYYRLARVLTCELAAGRPQGFDPAVFESLWVFLQTWLTDKTGARLAMPGSEAGVRRFVALPLMHVPLRRLDIEKLPSFFVWAGYAAGASVPEKKLLYDLERWVRSYSSFSAAGTSALGDERRHAVVSQVAQELAAWDGSTTESSGRRIASVELMLDIVRYRPDLFYLPRRPDGFPAHFDDGVHAFDAGDSGWYEPIRLSVGDGTELSDGFQWNSPDSASLRRPATAVLPLGPSPDYTGFLSRSNLLRGTTCAVLCEESIVQSATDYLRASTGGPCSGVSYPNLPRGWRLFTNIRPDHEVDVPEGLDALSLANEVDIICAGGLRLGRRRRWLAGAPPKIIVTGLEKDELVKVDGHTVNVNEDGVLQLNGVSLGPGDHVIDAGSLERTIEIAEPQIRPLEQQNGFEAREHYVALPAGRWYLVGAVPGQITGCIEVRRGGTICKANFDLVWAINVGAGPGATVASIERVPLSPAVTDLKSISTRHLQQWVSIIYDAAIRRPRLASLLPNSDAMLIDAVWKQYRRLAQNTKRQWRSNR